jgi:hypothetical protein
MPKLTNISSYGGCFYCDTNLQKKRINVKPIDYDRRQYFKPFIPGEWYYCNSCGRITKAINVTNRNLEIKEIYIDGITFWVAKNTRSATSKCWLYVLKQNEIKIPNSWETKNYLLLNWRLNNEFNFEEIKHKFSYSKTDVDKWLPISNHL